jgi:maleylacetate reductase
MTWRYRPLPADITFGWGSFAQLPKTVANADLNNVIVLCTPGHRDLADRAAALIGSRCAGVYPGARMHVPSDVVAAALEQAEKAYADGYLAVGGGSTVGLGKALALRTGLPLLAVPTTYAGSEVTPMWGETAHGVKSS